MVTICGSDCGSAATRFASIHPPWPCSRLLPIIWWLLCLHRFPVPACWPLSIGLPPRGGGSGEAAGGENLLHLPAAAAV